MWPSRDDDWDNQHLIARRETGPAVISTPVNEPDESVAEE